MKLKQRQVSSQMPEVNLVPMMDVIMTILTFFILVSMTLTNFQAVPASLPSTEKGKIDEKPVDPLIIGLDRQGQMLVNGTVANDSQVAQQIVAYFQKNAQGSIVLKADKSLPYEKVVKTLGVVRDVGGDRVSLAVE